MSIARSGRLVWPQGEFVVLEDNRQHLAGIRQGLADLGWRARSVSSSSGALRLARRGLKNYIVDINMGIDRFSEGLDTLEKLKQVNADIFVAVLSNYGGPWKVRALKLRADGFWKKSADQRADARRVVVALLSRRPRPEVEERFQRLAAQWRKEVPKTCSSVTQMAMHPAYQGIIGLGWEAVPLLLSELENRPDHWFWALKAITGKNPIKPAHQGVVEAMARAWIAWGRRQGYRW